MSDKYIKWRKKVTEHTDGLQNTAVTLLWCVLGVWFAFVTRRMLTDCLSVAADGSSVGFFCLAMLGTIGIVCWNRYAEDRLGKGRRLLGDVLLAAGCTVLFALCCGGKETDIPGGLQALARLYADCWKKNFGTELGFAYGSGASAWEALEFVVLVALVLGLLVAIRSKRSTLLIGLPLAVVGLALLVNVKPPWESLALLFAGGVIAIYMDRAESIHWKHFGILLAVLLLIVGAMPRVMEPAAESVYEIKEECLAFQQELEQGIKDFDLQGLFTDNVAVTNEAPEYEEIEVIQLLMENKTDDNIFLRGYHCNRYVGGAWERGNDVFARGCKEQGIKESDAAIMLLRLRYGAIGDGAMEYTLKYTGPEEKIAYMPYGTETVPEAVYKLTGDYRATKSKGTKEYTVLSVASSVPPFMYIEEGLMGQEKEFYSWYSDFVQENYMEVPENQKAVKELVKEIQNGTEYEQCMDALSEISEIEAVAENWRRMLLAAIVEYRLDQECIYSLELEELSAGQDPIEYFLGTSKEGYCVHFASAAVLMLREMGVPARYASGYLAKSNRIRPQDGLYAISVKDSDNHAWVEIYMEEYGWIPMDVTPEYSRMKINYGPSKPTGEESQEQPEAAESTAPEEDEVSEESTEQEASEETAEETTDDGVGFWPGGDTKGNGGAGSSFGANKVIVSFVLVVLVLLAGAIGWNIHARKSIDRSRLNTYIRRGDSRRAVLHMNYEIYRVASGHKQKGKMGSDEKYFGMLQNMFAEVEKEAWERYFETVRRASYSKADISEEDVRECYKVYYIITEKAKGTVENGR